MKELSWRGNFWGCYVTCREDERRCSGRERWYDKGDSDFLMSPLEAEDKRVWLLALPWSMNIPCWSVTQPGSNWGSDRPVSTRMTVATLGHLPGSGEKRVHLFLFLTDSYLRSPWGWSHLKYKIAGTVQIAEVDSLISILKKYQILVNIHIRFCMWSGTCGFLQLRTKNVLAT